MDHPGCSEAFHWTESSFIPCKRQSGSAGHGVTLTPQVLRQVLFHLRGGFKGHRVEILVKLGQQTEAISLLLGGHSCGLRIAHAGPARSCRHRGRVWRGHGWDSRREPWDSSRPWGRAGSRRHYGDQLWASETCALSLKVERKREWLGANSQAGAAGRQTAKQETGTIWCAGHKVACKAKEVAGETQSDLKFLGFNPPSYHYGLPSIGAKLRHGIAFYVRHGD